MRPHLESGGASRALFTSLTSGTLSKERMLRSWVFSGEEGKVSLCLLPRLHSQGHLQQGREVPELQLLHLCQQDPVWGKVKNSGWQRRWKNCKKGHSGWGLGLRDKADLMRGFF
jgi:hypothetical protein